MMIHDWNVRWTSLLIFERTQGFARFQPVTPNSEIGQFHAQQPSCHYTGQTPFSMIMGYTLKVEWPSMPSQVPSYMDRMEQIEQVHKAAKTSLDKAQKMMVIRNPSNKKFRPYQEGDQVWIVGTNLKTLYPSAKLTPKCYGPFKVMKLLSYASCPLSDPCAAKPMGIFHVFALE